MAHTPPDSTALASIAAVSPTVSAVATQKAHRALSARRRVLFSREAIARRVEEMGREISIAYGDSRPVLVGALKGAIVMLADLSRALRIPHEIDCIIVSSYGDATKSSGRVVIHYDVRTEIKGRDVLIVEGVVDTGLTLQVLMEHLTRSGARSVRVATLLDKVPCRKIPVDVHYVGFRIADEFVVGYGMDYAGYLRYLPDVEVVEPDGPPAASESGSDST